MNHGNYGGSLHNNSSSLISIIFILASAATSSSPVLPGSISGDSTTILSTHVEMLHQHFQTYYHALDAAASSDASQDCLAGRAVS
ncbi:hypothetical protein JHK86_024386 [Glycine max]|nr:hypothetical protein JHK86_024386 [Glycine max]